MNFKGLANSNADFADYRRFHHCGHIILSADLRNVRLSQMA